MKGATFLRCERVSDETSSLFFNFLGVFVLTAGFHILYEGLTLYLPNTVQKWSDMNTAASYL